MTIKRSKNEYSIRAVDNSFDVLEQFITGKSSLGITELSTRLGLHKNNIFRLLATLQNRDYIEQDQETGSYKLGTKILELSFAYHRHNGLLKLSTSALNKLVQVTQENAYLGLLKSNKIVYVEHAQSSQVLRVSTRIGIRLSPLCTAIGKVILAFSSESERSKVIKANEFVKYTNNTILDEESFYKELNKVKKQGFAIDNSELDEGVSCVAAPIFNYERKIVAGISISGPTSRLNDAHIKNLIVPALIDNSIALSRSIGYIDEID